MAGRTDELALELGLRRVLLARERGGNDGERKHGRERKEPPHDSVFRIASSRSASSVISPTLWSMIVPFASTKNVSGRPVIPHGSQSFAGPS